MQQTGASARSARELLDANRRYYDMLWSGARLIEPRRFNTWPLVQSLLPGGGARLEVGPGLRPRLPLENTQFVDISRAALEKLRERGASVVMGLVTALPFAAASFDLVCALDIVEHVADEHAAFGELSRVARPGAALLLSVPLHPESWSAFDEFVGHYRRYDSLQLRATLRQHRFEVERSAVFGMQPRSQRLVDLGMWWLNNRPERALWWYNRAIMPLGLRLQKKLDFSAGFVETTGVDEILMVCRRQRG